MQGKRLRNGYMYDDGEGDRLLFPETTNVDEDELVTPTNHLSEWSAVFFVVGNVLGAGLVALPYAMKMMHYYGTFMFIICASLMCYCGILLAKSCNSIMCERRDRELLRDPYPTLAELSLGKKSRFLVVVTLNTCLFVAAVVLILLTSEILSKLIALPLPLSERNKLRIWFVLCAHVLLPLTYFGTPKDFLFVAVLATITSAAAAVLIIINLFLAYGNVERKSGPEITASSAFIAFGTILFGFGGISVFPNVQNDLKNPAHFVRAVTIGYFIVTVINTAVPLAGFAIFGGLIKDDILTTMTDLPFAQTSTAFKAFVIIAQILLCIHIMCSYILNINTFHLQVEGYFNIPVYFCWQRVAVRTSSMVVILGICLAVPNFGPVLSFVGGVFSALLEIILPVVFFWALQTRVSIPKQLFYGTVIVLALIGASGNAFVGIQSIIRVIEGTFRP